MKRIRILFGILCLGVLTACSFEAEWPPREYPQVETVEPELDEGGVTFKAELLSLGTNPISKAGFMWSKGTLDTKTGKTVFYEGAAGLGTYTCRVTDGFTLSQYQVRAYVLIDSLEIFGEPVTFTSLCQVSPVISGFSPTSGIYGTNVVIEGANLMLDNIKPSVTMGGHALLVNSASTNRLEVVMPDFRTNLKLPLIVDIGNTNVTSADSFDFRFPWKQRAESPRLEVNASFFSLNGLGYIIDRYATTLMRYDPATNTWMCDLSLPEASDVETEVDTTVTVYPLEIKHLSFSTSDKAYTFLSENFWEYNPSIFAWVQKKAYPGTLEVRKNYMYGFTIDDHIYMGDCTAQYQLWKYDPQTDSWQRRSGFDISGTDVSGMYSFSYGGKGYLGLRYQMGENTRTDLREYNPSQDTWTQKTALPGTNHDYMGCFVQDGSAYVGFGSTDDPSKSNTLWKYDIAADSWSRCTDCPRGFQAYATFGLNGRGYFISGVSGVNWEYDPSRE
jgi:hypothetical protein